MILSQLQRNYIYNQYCEIENIIPDSLSIEIFEKAQELILNKKIYLVNHQGLGTKKELDGSGKYFHHIFKGTDIRRWFPELIGLYHAFLPIVSWVTCTETVLSPYLDSDINIKAYPPGGGTIGWHYDTNAITVLLYLTSNKEAPLEMQIQKKHPSKKDWIENVDFFSKKGSLFLMQGRKIWHQSQPTIKEHKMVVVFNYYTKDDQWRPSHFDDFVYKGGTHK